MDINGAEKNLDQQKNIRDLGKIYRAINGFLSIVLMIISCFLNKIDKYDSIREK